MGSNTSNIVTTDAFHDVVVAETTWFWAIGKRIATRRKPIIISTTTVSESPALFVAMKFWVIVCVFDWSARIGASKNASIVCLTLGMARVAIVNIAEIHPLYKFI